jgi:myo-inositol-1(or 4)-monophosphatase
LPKTDLSTELKLIVDAALEGGRIAMGYFGQNPDTWYKEGQSPVTAADIAVDTYLKETLLSARPTYGWLSEETVDNPDRLSATRTFVVDPIDGTRAFIAGKPTWCVSIAVVEAGISLAGVLFCPVTKELFSATLDGEALLNGEPISVATVSGQKLRIAGPKSMLEHAPVYIRNAGTVPHIPSLAYRIALVAKGDLDATFVKPNAHDWDLAAADLILQRAGGTILNSAGEKPRYAEAVPRHGELVAGNGPLLEDMAAVIASRQS